MNSQADLPIGVYDSGIGGLSIALAIRRHLPHDREGEGQRQEAAPALPATGRDSRSRRQGGPGHVEL